MLSYGSCRHLNEKRRRNARTESNRFPPRTGSLTKWGIGRRWTRSSPHPGPFPWGEGELHAACRQIWRFRCSPELEMIPPPHEPTVGQCVSPATRSASVWWGRRDALPTIPPLPFGRGEGRGEGSVRSSAVQGLKARIDSLLIGWGEGRGEGLSGSWILVLGALQSAPDITKTTLHPRVHPRRSPSSFDLPLRPPRVAWAAGCPAPSGASFAHAHFELFAPDAP